MTEKRQRAIARIIERHCKNIGAAGYVRQRAILRALGDIYTGSKAKAAIRRAITWAQAKTDGLTLVRGGV